MTHPHKKLIDELWPDKLLYAGLMVLLTGLLGAIQAVAFMMASVRITDRVPQILHPWDNFVTLSLSLMAVLFAFVGIRRVSLRLVGGGILAGLVSFSLLGMGSLFCIIAAGFLVKSWQEGEHRNARTRELDVLEWPDKTLAASLVSFVGGLLSLGWAALLLSGMVQMGTTTSILWAALDAVSGALFLVAAFLLHRQRGRGVGIAAGILAIPAAAVVAVGPILGIIALALIAKAQAEDEFEPTSQAA